jgi:hypothetical protein
MKNPNTFN